MKILFCLFSRLGDVICGIPAYLALREKYPDAELTWTTLRQYEPLVPKCGFVRAHGSPPFGSMPGWAKQPNYDLVIRAQPMWRHREWEKSGLHAIDLICKWAGVAPKHKHITIKVPDRVYQKVAKICDPGKPYVTICSSPCYSCGNWPYQMRQAIVDHFRKRKIPVVTVGGKDGVNIKGAIHVHGKLSYLGSLAMISNSSLYIGPDTGVTWLACAARKTAKLCIIDKNRLKQGVVGFGSVLSDNNIKDMFYQDNVKAHIKAADELYKRSTK